MIETPVDLIAMPGDAGLDCHLTGLRLASVVDVDTALDAECLLLFDTADAIGWWIDSNTGELVYPDRVAELTAVFGVEMAPGHRDAAVKMVDRLKAWAEAGVPLEMTSAPGKWTLLRSGFDNVPIPRGLPKDENADA